MVSGINEAVSKMLEKNEGPDDAKCGDKAEAVPARVMLEAVEEIEDEVS